MTGIAPALLAWWDVHGRRDLPWQRDPTPYRVWVSEVMLQQTQVVTVERYYDRFMAAFPDLQSLAAASEDAVLHAWSGLGYYGRARQLQHAARRVCEAHGGVLPMDLDALMALPGIGRSTAGAILALAGGQRQPILDGNVKRVLTRCFGVEGYPGKPAVERKLWALAEACTPEARAAEYTQAIMDLGATVCTRARPACLLCPVNAGCVARAENLQHRLPAPRPRVARPTREAWLVVAMRGGHKVLLERRPPSGIWGGLWGLPECPTRAHAEQWCREHLSGAGTPRESATLKHAFSHFDYRMRPLVVHCLGKAESLRDDDRFRWYDAEQPAQVGLPKPIATLVARVTRNEESD